MRLAEAPRDNGGEHAKARVGRRALWGYGLLTLAILIPGLVMRTLGPIVDAPAVSSVRLAVQSALEPISFGSGLRFWLGVAGTTMMALLLLYPLRKRLGLSRFAGSVGGWFHIHLALGLIGPALVLYHANFGFGSFNANVALWSVGIVLASGLVALTVYLTASERMARARHSASESLDDILRILRPPGHHDLAGTRLIEEIRALHGRIEDRKGMLPSLALRRESHVVTRDATSYVQAISLKAGAPTSEAAQLATSFRARLHATFATARRSARSAAVERMTRLWRLLHLPVIAVGAMATTLHVYAVWGVEDEPPTPAPIVAPAPKPARAQIAKAKPGNIEMAGVRRTPFAAPASQRTEPGIANQTASAATASPPELKQGPLPVSRGAATKANPPLPVTADAPPPTPTVFKAAAAPRPATTPEPVAKPRRPDDGAAAVAELRRRNDAAPSRIGDLDGLSLAAKIAQLKTSNFDHARTNFALTGKHKQVRCETCHTKTLIDTPRDCIACHRRDDVHRGRRPDCARCHTTNRWSEIIRRR